MNEVEKFKTQFAKNICYCKEIMGEIENVTNYKFLSFFSIKKDLPHELVICYQGILKDYESIYHSSTLSSLLEPLWDDLVDLSNHMNAFMERNQSKNLAKIKFEFVKFDIQRKSLAPSIVSKRLSEDRVEFVTVISEKSKKEKRSLKDQLLQAWDELDVCIKDDIEELQKIKIPSKYNF